MKLSKLHLFLIIIVVIVLSTLGFSVKEYFESGGAGDAQAAMEREKERPRFRKIFLSASLHLGIEPVSPAKQVLKLANQAKLSFLWKSYPPILFQRSSEN